MITLHLEAETPAQLVDDLKKMFNLTEIENEAVSINTVGDVTTENLKDVLAAESAAPPAKRTRKTKGAEGPSTAEVKAATIGEAPTKPDAAPAFLSEGANETKPEAEPEMSLDDMRAAAQKLAEAKGMDAVAKILGTFKDEKGNPALKMSLVQPGDRAKAAAAFEAAAAKKE